MPLFILVVLVVLVAWLFGRGVKGAARGGRTSSTAMGILQDRYAKGEITAEQFEQMKKALQR